MKKYKSIISMGICLLACLMLLGVGIYASTINKVGVSITVSYEQGTYAKVFVATSNATNAENHNYNYTGEGTFPTAENSFLVFDSYTGDRSMTPYTTADTLNGATCDKYGYFTLYVYVENYSNWDIWTDINVKVGNDDLNSLANNFSYTTSDWDLINAKNGATVDSSIRTITLFTEKALSTKSLTVNVSLHKNYEYLESTTNTPCIDTGYTLTSDCRIETDLAVTSSTNGFLFGSRTSNASAKNFELYATALTTIRYDYFSSTLPTFNVALTTNQFCKINFNKNQVYIDNTIKYTGTQPETLQTTGYPCFIFGLNDGGAINTSYYRTMKVATFKIYDGDELKRDFIPAKTANGVACMYDKVTKQFFLNASSGTFSLGEYSNSYNYLTSSGTQYITLDYIPNNNTEITVAYSTTSIGKFVFGSRTTSSSNDKFALYVNSNTSIYPMHGSEINTSIDVSPNNSINYVTLKKNKVFSQNTLVHTFTQQTFNSPYNLALFGVQQLYANTVNVNDRSFVGNIYYFKVYENGKLLYDLIPAKNSSNVACMYDIINHNYLTNQGSGTFSIA